MKNKRFLLLRELIEAVGHEDEGLFLDLVSGGKITGNRRVCSGLRASSVGEEGPVASGKVFSG